MTQCVECSRRPGIRTDSPIFEPADEAQVTKGPWCQDCHEMLQARSLREAVRKEVYDGDSKDDIEFCGPAIDRLGLTAAEIRRLRLREQHRRKLQKFKIGFGVRRRQRAQKAA